MIHGPPGNLKQTSWQIMCLIEILTLKKITGTGKTRTIVGLVMQILFYRTNANNKTIPKVLICAPSNTALDELMTRIDAALKETHGNAFDFECFFIIIIARGFFILGSFINFYLHLTRWKESNNDTTR